MSFYGSHNTKDTHTTHTQTRRFVGDLANFTIRLSLQPQLHTGTHKHTIDGYMVLRATRTKRVAQNPCMHVRPWDRDLCYRAGSKLFYRAVQPQMEYYI